MKKSYKVGDWVRITSWIAARTGSAVVKIVSVYSAKNFGVVDTNGKYSFLRIENIVEKYVPPASVSERKLMEILNGI